MVVSRLESEVWRDRSDDWDFKVENSLLTYMLAGGLSEDQRDHNRFVGKSTVTMI